MATTQSQQNKQAPSELARSIVKDHLVVGDIEWMLGEHATADPRVEKLRATLYPEYKTASKRISKLYKKVDPKVVGEIDELRWTEINAYAIAAFELGFAAAMQLCGKQGAS